jgi:DNA adenine methylase
LNYHGGKGGAGVYQQIINLMPAHETYVETHLGGGNILLRKRPARSSIAIEIDTRALWDFRNSVDRDLGPIRYENCDCVAFLRAYPPGKDALIYADPPYVMSARKSKRTRYRYEWTDEDHIGLLSVLQEVPAFVMVSGYPSALYDDALSRWHTHTFGASTRRGLATEKIWMNFDPATVMKHEYTYAGQNFRERERIKRKATRWVSNLARLPGGERNFILEQIRDAFEEEFHHHSSNVAYWWERETGDTIRNDERRRSPPSKTVLQDPSI